MGCFFVTRGLEAAGALARTVSALDDIVVGLHQRAGRLGLAGGRTGFRGDPHTDTGLTQKALTSPEEDDAARTLPRCSEHQDETRRT